jgi:hypothetical protein
MAEARNGPGARPAGTAGKTSTSSRSKARSAGPDGPEQSSEQAAPFRSAFGGGGGHVCPVAFCPVGMALTFAEAARPEVVQHLMAAGQELLLAVKAMIDARAEAMSDSPGFEHIRIR